MKQTEGNLLQGALDTIGKVIDQIDLKINMNSIFDNEREMATGEQSKTFRQLKGDCKDAIELLRDEFHYIYDELEKLDNEPSTLSPAQEWMIEDIKNSYPGEYMKPTGKFSSVTDCKTEYEYLDFLKHEWEFHLALETSGWKYPIDKDVLIRSGSGFMGCGCVVNFLEGVNDIEENDTTYNREDVKKLSNLWIDQWLYTHSLAHSNGHPLEVK